MTTSRPLLRLRERISPTGRALRAIRHESGVGRASASGRPATGAIAGANRPAFAPISGPAYAVRIASGVTESGEACRREAGAMTVTTDCGAGISPTKTGYPPCRVVQEVRRLSPLERTTEARRRMARFCSHCEIDIRYRQRGSGQPMTNSANPTTNTECEVHASTECQH